MVLHNVKVYVSVGREVNGSGFYAGMDCCCNAGSIAISGGAPPLLDIKIWDKCSVAYDTWPAAGPTGWSTLPFSSLSCLDS